MLHSLLALLVCRMCSSGIAVALDDSVSPLFSSLNLFQLHGPALMQSFLLHLLLMVQPPLSNVVHALQHVPYAHITYLCSYCVFFLLIYIYAVYFKFGRRGSLLFARLPWWGWLCVYVSAHTMVTDMYVCILANIIVASLVSFSWRDQSVPHFAKGLAPSARFISFCYDGMKKHVILNISTVQQDHHSHSLMYTHILHTRTHTHTYCTHWYTSIHMCTQTHTHT